jgi:hypothetical protein
VLLEVRSVADNATASGNGAGSVSDILTGFAQAAVKWSASPTADPDVPTAVSLGWSLRDAAAWSQTDIEPDNPALQQLPADLRWSGLLGQIKASWQRLANRVSEAGQDAAAITTKLAAVPAAPSAEFVQQVHAAVITALFATDSSLAKAYNLGDQMASLCGPTRDTNVQNLLQEHGSALKELLGDLASRLPANAAHTVMNSLTLWEGEVLIEQSGGNGLAQRLQQQGKVWRTILIGEVAPKDILRLSDYIGSMDGVVRRLRNLALQTIRRMPGLTAAVGVLLVGGIVLLSLDSSGSIVGGAASLFAAFGLTWKGIGEFFGRAAAKGEQALWDAQLDWTIAYRCTIGDPEADPAPRRNARIAEHLKTWRDWNQRWPNLSVESANGREPLSLSAETNEPAETIAPAG